MSHPTTWIRSPWSWLLVAQLPLLGVYLYGLSGRPIYGVLAWGVPLAAVGMLALAWDRRWRPLNSRPMATLVGAGCIVACIGAVSGSAWTAYIGWLACVVGCLSSQRDRDGRSLLPLAWPWFALLALTGDAEIAGLQWLTESAIAEATGLLRTLSVPHVVHGPAIAVPEGRVHVDAQVESLMAWPLFLSVALLHSAWWRRSWMVTGLNAVSALLWCVAFHGVLVVGRATLAIRGDARWIEWAVPLVLGGLVYLLFLSTERGIRSVLWPIPKESSDAVRSNPWVWWWNSMVAERQFPRGDSSSRATRRRLTQPGGDQR